MGPTANSISKLRYTVIGGGIIGLATARELLVRGVRNVTVVEAEAELARHQTGHNSGVVHAGLYYHPNSLKAHLCRQGMQLTKAYCAQRGIPYKEVGKLVVAVYPSEIPALHHLYANAKRNAVPDISLLTTPQQVHDIEPSCGGIAAIHSPHTAIVDWCQVAKSLAEDICSLHGIIMLSSSAHALVSAPDSLTLYLRGQSTSASTTSIQADRLITCAGIQSDRVARALGASHYPIIIPVRGEYMRLTRKALVRPRTNIYPVPPVNQASAPFLGVHFTPTLSGDVIVGPNAVPALARNGYSWRYIDYHDIMDMIRHGGFWNVAIKHFRFAICEIYKSFYSLAAKREAIRFVPALKPSDFEPHPSSTGVRAQAVASDGSLIDDFVFESTHGNRVLHVRNAPSPGATSSLAIARMIVDRSLRSPPHSD